LDKRIYKTEIKFWAVLGSRGCKEKKLPIAISMQLFEVVFSTFCGQKENLNFFKDIVASALKSYIIHIKLRKILKKSYKNKYRLKIGEIKMMYKFSNISKRDAALSACFLQGFGENISWMISE
jgi:hypothetical protein